MKAEVHAQNVYRANIAWPQERVCLGDYSLKPNLRSLNDTQRPSPMMR